MTLDNKCRIEEAVNKVRKNTENRFDSVCTVEITYVKQRFIGYVFEDIIKISRSATDDDLTYKLYTKHDNRPLITLYGCWPTEFVTDMFIRTLEHFYNDYSK